MAKVVIVGAGGFSKNVIDIIEDINVLYGRSEIEALGFIVDDEYKDSFGPTQSRKIIGNFSLLYELTSEVGVVVAIGTSELRYRVVARILESGARFETLIHPNASISKDTVIGAGVVICPGCVVSGGTSLGDHVHLNPKCAVGHDVALEDFVSLAPSVSIGGHTRIEQGVFMGIGAVAVDRVTLGHWSRVGAGAVVISDVSSNSTVVGVPARQVGERPDDWHI